MIAILTRCTAWAVVDLQRDYSAVFDTQYSGNFLNGEPFRIFTNPERLYGVKLSSYITLTHSGYSTSDWRELREMEIIAECQVEKLLRYRK